MKNTFIYITSFATIIALAFSFEIVASAQDAGSTVKYDKTVEGPDANGVYTISLEAYVTGNITVTTSPAPADIILVLDKSGSMNSDLQGNSVTDRNQQNRRINVLKSAVQDFVETVKTSNSAIEAKDRDDYGGHRIAIVWFAGRVNTDWRGNPTGTYDVVYEDIDGLNEFQNVEDLTTVAASGTGNNYSAAQVLYNRNNLLNVSISQYDLTITDVAMQRAKSILSEQDYSDKTKRSRVVVFFTDGDPGWSTSIGWQNEEYMLGIANGCISAANDIKTSSTYQATLYSVGLFNKEEGTSDATTTYLRYTSSDETGVTAMPESSGYVPVSNDKSVVVSSAGALSNVFSSIATNAGGNYRASSSSSVMVDIVASSFTVSTDANLGNTKVYQVACTQASPTAIISFSSTKEEITNDVKLLVDDKTGEVSVTGFNYGENWCGWDGSANNNQGGPHGYKLVLEIPITVNDDAVGGPSVETNAAGSQLIIKDSDGNVIDSYDFISPTIKIPVQIWIQKNGLREGEDDSAVFTIYSAPFASDFDPEKAEWKSFTKVMITMDDKITLKNGTVVNGKKIVGLDPDNFYKIKEDGWAWTYTYQEGGVLYTVGEEEPKNPFVFTNIPDKVKFDEAKQRNVFSERKN